MSSNREFVPKQIATIIKSGRRGTGSRETLKESSYEQYLRIQKENEAKEIKRNKTAINKLRKEGKVQSIAGFLVCKKEEEADEWTQSKKEKFRMKLKKKGRTEPPHPPQHLTCHIFTRLRLRWKRRRGE